LYSDTSLHWPYTVTPVYTGLIQWNLSTLVLYSETCLDWIYTVNPVYTGLVQW